MVPNQIPELESQSLSNRFSTFHLTILPLATLRYHALDGVFPKKPWFKQKSETPESKLDKNGNPKKITRDLDSDWTIKNDKPHYGLKEHSAVDTEHGLILTTHLSSASHNDSTYLPLVAISSMHTKDKINKVYADKNYAGAPNWELLALNNIQDGIMRKDNKNAKLTELEIEPNKAASMTMEVGLGSRRWYKISSI